MHHFGVNCLEASTGKVKEILEKKKKKMGVAAKNDRFKVSFSYLCTGEFQHETYTETSVGLIIRYKNSQ